jgi:Rieske Fe-S protein
MIGPLGIVVQECLEMQHQMSRRDVIRASALLVGGVCSCRMAGDPQAAQSTCCGTPDIEPESVTVGQGRVTIDLKSARSLAKVGSAAYVVDQDKSLQLIVVHAGKRKYFALSRLCTHGGQVISYNRNRGLLQCNNFNHSIFDLDGEVWKGPAEKPLTSYAVTLVEDRLVIAV